MKKRTLLKVAVVPAIMALGFVTMQGLGSTQKQSNRRELVPEARAVETEALRFGDFTLRVEGDGVVESERTLPMIAEASGRVTFARADLKDGTFVRSGEIVVKIDSRDVENDLHALRSDFLNAVASVLPELRIDDARIYKRWFDYFTAIDIDESVPELPEITNAQEKIKVSTKDIIGKYYEIRNQEILLSKHTVRAPFDGYVSSSGVIEGSFVTMGQQLLTLTDPKNLVVKTPLLIEESQSIDFSTTPRVTIYADRASDVRLEGRITRKETKVDRNSQTLNVFVSFNNPGLSPRFLPGSYVHVVIGGRTLRDVAPLPRHLFDSQGYVFTMRDGRLARERLETVAFQGNVAVVRNTVADETVIVTTVLQKPLIGMRVRSINMPELNVEGELAGEGASESGLAEQEVRTESANAGG